MNVKTWQHLFLRTRYWKIFKRKITHHVVIRKWFTCKSFTIATCINIRKVSIWCFILTGKLRAQQRSVWMELLCIWCVCAMWQKRLTIKDDLFSEAFKSINSAVSASEILQWIFLIYFHRALDMHILWSKSLADKHRKSEEKAMTEHINGVFFPC